MPDKVSDIVSGADDEARTRYLNLGKVALYQMSYIRISLSDSCYYKTLHKKCQVFFEKNFAYL